MDLVYYWNIIPFDGEENGTISETWNFTIMSYVEINLTNASTNFGGMTPDATNDTTDNSPLPLALENIGNVFADVTFNGTWLFDGAAAGTFYYQFAADNTTGEPGSFNSSASQITFVNVDESEQTYLVEFNYSDSRDEAELEINLTIPGAEPPGTKQSIITLFATIS